MSKSQQSKQATVQASNEQQQVIAVEQPMDQLASLRQRRVAMVQAAVQKLRMAARQQYQQARQAALAKQQELAKRQAFELQVAQLAAQYGIAVNPAQVAPRANSATFVPSSNQINVGGQYFTPCKAVHAIAASMPTATRKQVLEACIAAGINKATASTQYGLWKNANK